MNTKTEGTTRSTRIDEIWKRAYQARTKDQLMRLYRDWAATYDADHEQVGFFGHRLAAEITKKYVPFSHVAPVLDAGAGTGAAGVELARLGFGNLTAVDLSEAMLEKAEAKGVYSQLFRVDLGLPLDTFPADHFDAAILVGVFSYGQAPAHCLDEIVRVVKPGGVIVFTMRTDFYEKNAMGVRGKITDLEHDGSWTLVEKTDPRPYLPKKDPDAQFCVWCYRVLDTKAAEAPSDLADAVRKAFLSSGRVKRLDHCHIWDSMASRLYNRYVEQDEYYLIDCEEEILEARAGEIVGRATCFVELGCGSARKVRPILENAIQKAPAETILYEPIDLSAGALSSTKDELLGIFGESLRIEPRQGHFREIIPTIASDAGRVLLFFGSSLGNIESLGETVDFLRGIRDVMNPQDRLIVGVDLHKEEDVLINAYTAGSPNRSFFLNMLRRINHELGGNLDLNDFVQESTYDRAADWNGIEDRCVNLKLRTRSRQVVWLSKLGLEVTLEEGDAIQVGTSRKFRAQDIERLAQLSGLRFRGRWLDRREWFSVNELVRDDAPERA
jgi:uncharacterized SAM-dependent methyltransferase/ubiquinone/menaquinone biosynthesis C-methylase UbiE